MGYYDLLDDEKSEKWYKTWENEQGAVSYGFQGD